MILYLKYTGSLTYETSDGGWGGTREFDEPPKEEIFKNEISSKGRQELSKDDFIQVNLKKAKHLNCIMKVRNFVIITSKRTEIFESTLTWRKKDGSIKYPSFGFFNWRFLSV